MEVAMKATRSYLMVICLVAAGLCLANLVSLSGFFRALERSDGVGGSEKQIFAQLTSLTESLKSSDDPEEAKKSIRAFEAAMGSGVNREKLDGFRREFSPLISAFASKPREAEDRFLLTKKRELMEGLVNAYRKEISDGRIPVRAAYLNILFDTQNSLLNEGEETEQVYLRRNKERFTALRGLAVGDEALNFRVDNLVSIFGAFEKGLQRAVEWRQQKSAALAKVEKALPKLSRELFGESHGQMEDLRRFFLYCCIFGLAAGLASFAIFYLAHKVLKLKFYNRTDSFLQILRGFGSDRMDPAQDKELTALKADPDWITLTEGMLGAEAEFVAKYQTLLAVPKSMSMPYAVIGKNRKVCHFNKGAEVLFGVSGKKEASLDDLICESRVAPRSGDKALFLELVRNSLSSLEADAFEMLVKTHNAWAPYELLSFPIVNGPLAGGRVYIFREIRNESERIDLAVSRQLEKVRAYANKIVSGHTEDVIAAPADPPEVKRALADLQTIKRRNGEREILWRSESGAVIEQVERQKEILQRLTAEIREIRVAHRQALELVGSIHGGDEDWHQEVCSMQSEMNRWKAMRARLESDLAQQATLLQRAKSYEAEVRISAEEMDSFLSGYEGILSELVVFTEEAKLHSVNMGFTKDPANREFAARSRAFSHEIGRFVDQAGRLSTKVRAFLAEHPASSLAPHLQSTDLDPAVLESFEQEEHRLDTYISRWKESGEEILAGGEKALGLLREADKKSALLTQLGETSILINEQAKGNLERWN
jgi:hypothetical protein